MFPEISGMDMKELHMPVLTSTSTRIAPPFVQERFPVVFGMDMKELRIRPATRTVKGQGFGEACTCH